MNIIKTGYPEGEEVLVENVQVTYLQEADCTESSDNDQTITLSTRDGGGGKFIHIKTNGWSIEDADELIKLVEHFKSLYL